MNCDLDVLRNKPIKGYVHPTTTNDNIISDKDDIYRTFNKNSTKSKYDNPYINTKYYQETIQDTDIDNCPICKKKYLSICRCVNSCRKCESDHKWYINRNGEIITGDPHSKDK
jgi:hypothetical protein